MAVRRRAAAQPGGRRAYALPNAWPLARRRLELIARHHDPATRRRLRAVGLAPGWRCLEVGAGRGTIARWMCGVVGPRGSVTATDIDVGQIGPRRPASLTVLRHDVTRDALPGGRFDLVHVRWVLHHLARPDEVVRRLLDATRPGGWLVVEELDGFPVAASASAAYVALWRACTGAVEDLSGGSYAWARGLPALMAALGLEEQGGEVDVPLVAGASQRAELLRLSFLQVRDRVLASGRMAAADFDRAIAELDDPAFRGYSAATVAVWGRRPPDATRGGRGGAG